MGAVFNTIKVTAATDKEALAGCRAAIEESRYEDGHSYSGGIGMADGCRIVGFTFATADEAYDWLEENAEKYGPALGVKLKEGGYAFGALCSS